MKYLIESNESKEWSQDLRWRDVYGHIKPIRVNSSYDVLSPIQYYEIIIVVRFDGVKYYSRIRVEPNNEHITDVIDKCVTGIDEMLLKQGVSPYSIQS